MDFSGRDAAAVAVGDLDATRPVAVVATDGLATEVHKSLGGKVDDMQRLQSAAQRRVAHRRSRSETVATVTWLGYEAPQWRDTLDASSVAESNHGGRHRRHPARQLLPPRIQDQPRRRSPPGRGGTLWVGRVGSKGPSRVRHGVDDVVILGSAGIGVANRTL